LAVTQKNPNFAAIIIILVMSYTKTTVIKNPSSKLEEHIRKIGVQKYLWLEKLCSDDVKPTKVINLK
jgi:hypothetical protein